MSSNFLIALATALASATVILLALRIILKISAPNAFKEKVPIPSRPANGQMSEVAEISTAAQHLIIDSATLTALTGSQVTDLLMQPSSLIIAEPAVQDIGKQKQNALSPPGQSRSPNLGTADPTKSNMGATYETLCGSAR